MRLWLAPPSAVSRPAPSGPRSYSRSLTFFSKRGHPRIAFLRPESHRPNHRLPGLRPSTLLLCTTSIRFFHSRLLRAPCSSLFPFDSSFLLGQNIQSLTSTCSADDVLPSRSTKRRRVRFEPCLSTPAAVPPILSHCPSHRVMTLAVSAIRIRFGSLSPLAGTPLRSACGVRLGPGRLADVR